MVVAYCLFMSNTDAWMTVREACERVGVSRATLMRWIAAGRLRTEWFGGSRAVDPQQLAFAVANRPVRGRPHIDRADLIT